MDALLYAVTLTFDLKHLQRIACDVMKFCTKFERNRALCLSSLWLSSLSLCLIFHEH